MTWANTQDRQEEKAGWNKYVHGFSTLCASVVYLSETF